MGQDKSKSSLLFSVINFLLKFWLRVGLESRIEMGYDSCIKVFTLNNLESTVMTKEYEILWIDNLALSGGVRCGLQRILLIPIRTSFDGP
jgi:hypothetical protein